MSNDPLKKIMIKKKKNNNVFPIGSTNGSKKW